MLLYRSTAANRIENTIFVDLLFQTKFKTHILINLDRIKINKSPPIANPTSKYFKMLMATVALIQNPDACKNNIEVHTVHIGRSMT